ncbi:MAG: chemotaxis protein CheC [Haloarculaceae archaeon]
MPILIDIRKLRIINRLIKDGASNVASALETMAGVESTVRIKSLAFVDPEDLPHEIGNEALYSARVRLREPPYGVFFLTFADETAVKIASLMTGIDAADGLNDMHESALQEICNIMTSGFIDGVANTLETTIDMGTPTITRGCGQEVVDKSLTHINEDSLTIVLDAVVDVADRDTAFEVRIFLVPDPGSFVNMIDKIEMGDLSSAVEGHYVEELGNEGSLD